MDYGGEGWLKSARLKFSRAISHYDDLERESKAFLNSRPYSVVVRYDGGRGFFVSQFQIGREVPDRLSLILGDLLANLRSALDHLAWAIACQSTPPEVLWSKAMEGKARKVAFPIAWSRDKFDGLDVIKMLDPKAIELLETFQPYHRTETAGAIEALHAFNNIDKHRLIHSAGGLIDLSAIRVRPVHSIFATGDEVASPGDLGELFIEQVHAIDRGLKHGTELHHLRFENGPPKHEGEAWIEVTTQPTYYVVFSAGGLAKDVGYFKWLIGEVGRVESKVSQLFGSLWPVV